MAKLAELPNEVLLLVAERMKTQRDISSFAQCSQKMYNLIHPRLCLYNFRHHHSSAVICAARNGQTRLLTQLREAGADLRCFESEQQASNRVYSTCQSCPQNPLLLAAQQGHTETLKLLLSWAPPLSLMHATLRWSIHKENTELLDLMLPQIIPLSPYGTQRGASSALGIAVRVGSIPMVTRLIKGGAKIHPGETPKPWLIALRTLPIFQLLLESGHRPSDDGPLFHAAADNNIPGIQLLIDHGFNIEVYGHHSLFYAVEEGSTDAVKFLIDKAANPHLASPVKYGDVHTHSTIWYAVRYKQLETLRILLERGVQPDRADLTLARRMNYRGAISLLSPYSFDGIPSKESIDAFTSRLELELSRVYPETDTNRYMPFLFKSRN